MPALAWVNLIVGLVAASGVIITWRQKVEADRRAEWWRRVSWAFDQILSGDDERVSFGWSVTQRLRQSKLATSEDKEMFLLLADHWVISEDGEEQAGGGSQ